MITNLQIAEWQLSEAKRRFDCAETNYYAQRRHGLNLFSLQLLRDELRTLAMQHNRAVDNYLYAALSDRESEYTAARILLQYAIASHVLVAYHWNMFTKATTAKESADLAAACRANRYLSLEF
jgi:hypothetical protein